MAFSQPLRQIAAILCFGARTEVASPRGAGGGICSLLGRAAFARQGKPVKVALIEDKTGQLEASARHLVAGFRLGPEYAGKGSNTAPARRIEILQQDSHFRPTALPRWSGSMTTTNWTSPSAAAA